MALARFLHRFFARPKPRAAALQGVPVEVVRAMTAAEWRTLLAGPLDQAVPRIEAAARDGVVEAMLVLGQMLLDGRAVARDPAWAAAWFAVAAAAGNPMGTNMLGRCHECGWGVPADRARAADLYARAAQAGLDWAQFNLGMMALRQGERGRAEGLFRAAAAQGHAKAMNMLAMLAPHGAAAWYRGAAEGGDFRGQFNLGCVLAEAGEAEQACVWFGRALASGNPDVLAGMVALAAHSHAGLRALGEAALRRRARAARG